MAGEWSEAQNEWKSRFRSLFQVVASQHIGHRKRTTSNTTTEETNETMSRPRRGQKPTRQETSEQFLFSQPEKPDNSSLDQKAIGEVPKYVFSPPHTRSKAIAPDYQWKPLCQFWMKMKQKKRRKKNNGMYRKVQGWKEHPNTFVWLHIAIEQNLYYPKDQKVRQIKRNLYKIPFLTLFCWNILCFLI